MLISTRNAPTLPNFKSFFQSVEAPEVLKQRDGRKKKKNLAKLPFFPNLLLKLGKKKKSREKVQPEAEQAWKNSAQIVKVWQRYKQTNFRWKVLYSLNNRRLLALSTINASGERCPPRPSMAAHEDDFTAAQKSKGGRGRRLQVALEMGGSSMGREETTLTPAPQRSLKALGSSLFTWLHRAGASSQT